MGQGGPKEERKAELPFLSPPFWWLPSAELCLGTHFVCLQSIARNSLRVESGVAPASCPLFV